MGVTFTPLAESERNKLLDALRRNAGDGAALLMDRRDTTFREAADTIPDEDVVTAIRSIPCHYSDDRATRLALELLRGNQTYIQDAREGARVGNSVVGSLLSLPPHSIPRRRAEQAVLSALAILDSSAAESVEPDRGGNYTLPRSGKAPLRFQGELLAESDGERQTGRDWTRWHELAVYRTAGGKFVVRIAYRTRYQGEVEHDQGEVVYQPGEVEAEFLRYSPAEHVRGFPPHESYAERQASLMADIQARYAEQVSEILRAAPEFAETVE